MTRRLIDRAGVALMLGITVEKFYRRYAELRANPANPFPGPALGNQSGARWDPLAIERWIDAGGEHGTAQPVPPPGAAMGEAAERQAAKAARRARAQALAEAS